MAGDSRFVSRTAR